MGLLLNQSGRHAHSHTPPPSSPGGAAPGEHKPGQDSLAVRAAFVHALGDLVQSVGVLIAAYIIRFKVQASPAGFGFVPLWVWVFGDIVSHSVNGAGLKLLAVLQTQPPNAGTADVHHHLQQCASS